jgi:quercetin dioxygenase-like cupin family protein
MVSELRWLLMIKWSLFIVFVLLMPAVVIPQANSPQNPVEIKGEPRHHPKFENEFVKVWDVTVPGGDSTLWHAHRNDNVVVTLAPARLHIETLGRDPVDAEWKYGEVRFSQATYVHRAMNVGTTDFHNLTIELLKPASVFGNSQPLPKESDREPVLENQRVRVFRYSLKPGETMATHTHPLPGLSVTITAAEIEVTANGKTARHPVKADDVSWREANVTHSVKNVGKTVFDGVDIEFK